VLFLAVREFGASAVGIEVGPIQCALIWLRIKANGLTNQIQIKWANFYNADVSKADIVFVYATSTETIKLAPHLESHMKPGSRLVSISADFPEWEPSALDEHELIFVYQMPPTKGSMMSYMLKKAK
jgi:hypothetical protein